MNVVSFSMLLNHKEQWKAYILEIEEVHMRVIVAADAVVEHVQVLGGGGGESRHVLDATQDVVHRGVIPSPHPRPTRPTRQQPTPCVMAKASKGFGGILQSEPRSYLITFFRVCLPV